MYVRYDQDRLRTLQERIVKKGRHRRFEEARAMKRVSLLPVSEPCVECGAGADEKCASWCLARVLDEDETEQDEFYEDETDDVDDQLDGVEAVDGVRNGSAESEQATSTH